MKRVKEIPGLFLLLFAFIALTVAGCGGGGGGGAAPAATNTGTGGNNNPAPTYRNVTFQVNFQNTGRVAGREAEAIASGVQVVAYELNTSSVKTVLNTDGARTNSSGMATVTVPIRDGATLNLVFEALSGPTAQIGDPANISVYVPKVDAATYSAVDRVNSVVATPSTSSLVKNSNTVVSQLKALTGTTVTDEDLLAFATLVGDAAEIMNNSSSSATSDLIGKIDKASEATEIFTQFAAAITIQKTAYAGTAQKVAALVEALTAIDFGTSFANSSKLLPSDVKKLASALRIAYADRLGLEASKLTTLVSQGQFTSMTSGFSALRGLLIQVIVDQNITTRDSAAAMVKGFLGVLDRLGASSEGKADMSAVLDGWVTTYAEPAFQTDLAAFLTPLDMYDRTKTDHLMELAHDLAAEGSTRDGVLTVLNRHKTNGYTNQKTVDEGMRLYDKYAGKMNCAIGDSAAFCPTEDEIIGLLELHYDKKLPKLRLLIDGGIAWVQNPLNSGTLIGLGNAFNTTQQIYNIIYASDANKAALLPVMDNIGVPSGIFKLVHNVGPMIQ